MNKKVRSDLFGVCPDQIEEGDIFVAQVKPSKKYKDLRIVSLVKWEED